MAGAACKVIINGGLSALMSGLERILTNPDLHGGRLSQDECREMLDRMANLDTRHYSGSFDVTAANDSLRDIMCDLQRKEVLSDDVWLIYTLHVAE